MSERLGVPQAPTPDEVLDARLFAQLQAPETQPGDVADVAFYAGLCRGVDTVLELGCGAGRVTRALLHGEGACRVTGIDRHRGLLARTRDGLSAQERGRLTLVEGDLRTCDLGATFDRVIMPFTTFYALEGLPAKRAALEMACRHTAPGGVFALDCYAVDDGSDLDPQTPHDTGWDDLDETTLRTADGRPIRVEERNLVLGPPGRIEVQYRFHLPDRPGRPHVQTIRHHFVSASTTVRLLIEAGFSHAEVYGGFDGRDYDEDCAVMVVVAER